MNTIVYFEPDSEQVRELVQLSTGSILDRTSFVFSYETESTFTELEMFCEIYENGECIQSSDSLLSHSFQETLTGFSRQGKLLFDVNARSLSVTDNYYVMGHYITEDGELSTDERPVCLVYRESVAIPVEKSLQYSYRHVLFSSVYVDGSSKLTADEPVYLCLFIEERDEAVHRNASSKTAEEILTDPALMNEIDRCYIFGCIFH